VVVQPPPPTNNAIQAVQTTVKPAFTPPRPAPAAIPDSGFSPAHIVGGSRAPDYPESYQDAQRNGRVTVDCVIETSGHPANCKVLNETGGSAFAQATMQWLNGSNAPRFKPPIRNGQPVTEEHQWVITFVPPE
jgi:TonB family protein